MIDRIVALLALIALAAFLGVFVVRVREPDLVILVIGGVLIAAVDFYLALFRAKGNRLR